MSLADTLEVDGYSLSMLQFSHKGQKLKVSGRIKGGPNCNLLKLEIFLQNEEGDKVLVTSSVEKAGGYSKRLFSGYTTVYSEDSEWEISSIYAKCVSQ